MEAPTPDTWGNLAVCLGVVVIIWALIIVAEIRRWMRGD